MENQDEIYEKYLKGATPKELTKMYNVTLTQIHSKIKNCGWAKKKKELEKKAQQTNIYWINKASLRATERLYNIIDKTTNDDLFLRAVRVLNDINGLKKVDTQNDKKDDIPAPQFNYIELNNNTISDIQKLEKSAKGEVIIDLDTKT